MKHLRRNSLPGRLARGCAALLALGACLAPALWPAPPARADVTPEQIDQAIEKGKAYLYSQIHGDNWEHTAQPPKEDLTGLAGQWGGETAICTYTLLATGESPQKDPLHKAIVWLGNADGMRGIYAVGMRANVWPYIDIKVRRKPPYSLAVKRDMQLLYNAVKTRNPAISGMYNYFKDDGARIDHSVSQYGVLGMWAVADSEIGVEIDPDYWKVVEAGWRRDQEEFDLQNFLKKPDQAAGWGYENGKAHGKATASMTAAGVATLFITQDQLHFNEGIDCRGNMYNPWIEAGLNWLAKNFNQVNGNYTWYGIERIGVASGRKYFGTTDWFKVGAEQIVNSQDKNSGGWAGEHGSNVANTCFALLFLERGRAPVLMNKLQYEIFTNGDQRKDAPWNQRARDVANLARFVTKQSEYFRNWQIVNLKAPPEELHDSPILYIAGGKEGLFFSPAEEAKLKKFVEEGGIIVGNADCGSKAFADAFKKLGTKLFGNEFRNLTASEPHHILFKENGEANKANVEIFALSNGARELMFLFPSADPAKFWQTGAYGGKEKFHNIGLNLFLYATERQAPRSKGQTYIVKKDASPATKQIKLARLKYATNDVWDPEPYGWERLAAILHNVDKVDLQVATVELGAGKLDPKVYKVAHLTGCYGLALAEKQRAELKAYVENGGTVIIDACGGSAKFAQAAQTEISTMFPNNPLVPVPVGGPVYQAGAVKVDAVVYRSFALGQLAGGRRVPRVQMVELNNRPAVLFSREDLSVGLVGQSVDGIYGYAAQPLRDKEGKLVAVGASEVMSSLVLFAGGNGGAVAAATPPDKK